MLRGTRPIRAGQFFLINSKLCPIPPEVTITACAANSNSPNTFRDDDTPRAASLGSRTLPRTPVAAPLVTMMSSTRCR